MHQTSSKTKFWSLLFVLLVWGSNATALEPRGESIRISADDAQGSVDGGFVASGNVELTYGSMSLQADTMSLQVDNGTFEGIEATGSPVRLELSINNQGKQQTIHAEALMVIYRVAEEEIEFDGEAKVESEEISITGTKIWINIREFEIEAESLDTNDQVEIIFRDSGTEENSPEE